jgi:hypothetical protein
MKYTTWEKYDYNGVTVYLTAAPGNLRYTDPDNADAPEFLNQLPEAERQPQWKTIANYLRVHGPSTARQINRDLARNSKGIAAVMRHHPDVFKGVRTRARDGYCILTWHLKEAA